MKINGVNINPMPNVKAYENANENARFKRENASPIDQLDLSVYYNDLDAIQAKFRKIVEDLVKRQGKTLEDVNISVDDQARSEAQAMLDGPLSPEATSDRIVSFAKAIAGNDNSKFELLKGAIEEGFKEAEKILGELPEISQQTYDLVMEKLDAWKSEA